MLGVAQIIGTKYYFMVDFANLWIQCTKVAHMLKTAVWIGTVLSTCHIPLMTDGPMTLCAV